MVLQFHTTTHIFFDGAKSHADPSHVPSAEPPPGQLQLHTIKNMLFDDARSHADPSHVPSAETPPGSITVSYNKTYAF